MIPVPGERAYRRKLRIALIISAVAAFAPAVLQEGALVRLLAECEAIVTACLSALLLLSPIELVPFALLAGGAGYAVLHFVTQQYHLRNILRFSLDRAPAIGEPLHALGREHNLTHCTRIFDDPTPNPAFTMGLLRPRMYFSAALQSELTPSQLRAVFRHEVWHRRRRDPLRFAVLRALAHLLFWIPVMRVLAEELIEEAELMADDFAAELEDPFDVARAVVIVARYANTIPGAVGLHGCRPIERRIRRLVGDGVAPVKLAPYRDAVVSLVAIAAVWASAKWAPLVAPPLAETLVVAQICPDCADHSAMLAMAADADCPLMSRIHKRAH